MMKSKCIAWFAISARKLFECSLKKSEKQVRVEKIVRRRLWLKGGSTASFFSFFSSTCSRPKTRETSFFNTKNQRNPSIISLPHSRMLLLLREGALEWLYDLLEKLSQVTIIAIPAILVMLATLVILALVSSLEYKGIFESACSKKCGRGAHVIEESGASSGVIGEDGRS